MRQLSPPTKNPGRRHFHLIPSSPPKIRGKREKPEEKEKHKHFCGIWNWKGKGCAAAGCRHDAEKKRFHIPFFAKKEKEIEFRGGKKHLLVKFAGSNLYFSFEFDGEKELVTPRLSLLLQQCLFVASHIFSLVLLSFVGSRRLILKYQAINGRGRGGGHFLHHHLSTAASVAKEGSLNASRRRKTKISKHPLFFLPPSSFNRKGVSPIWQ